MSDVQLTQDVARSEVKGYDDTRCYFIIAAKAFARDYVITGVGLSVCLSVCLVW